MAIVKPVRMRKSYRDFSAGKNSAVDAVLLNDNEASDCQNVVLDQKGTVEKRKGPVKKNVAGLLGPILGMHSLYRKGSGGKFLLYVDGTTLYKLNTATGANEVVKAGLTAGKRMRFWTYRDKAFCTNGADAPFTYDGAATVNIGGAPPTSPLIVAHKNHVFMVDPATPNRLRFSDLDNPDSYPALNFIDVNSDDGDKITAYLPYKNRLLIFKERSVWQLLGDSASNFALDGPRSNYGAVNQEVVAICGDLVMFLSREGVVAFDLGRSVTVGDKIRPDIKRINQAAIEQAAAIFFDNKYILSVPVDATTVNNQTMVYDLLRQAWLPNVGQGYPGACYTAWAPAGIDLLYSGGANTGYVYEHGAGYNDDGAAIDSWWASKIWDLGAPDARKKFKSIYIYAKLQEQVTALDVEVDVDYRGWEKIATLDLTAAYSSLWDAATWDTDVWDGDPEAKAFRIPYSGRGTFIRVRVRNAELDRTFRLYGITFFSQVKPVTK